MEILSFSFTQHNRSRLLPHKFIRYDVETMVMMSSSPYALSFQADTMQQIAFNESFAKRNNMFGWIKIDEKVHFISVNGQFFVLLLLLYRAVCSIFSISFSSMRNLLKSAVFSLLFSCFLVLFLSSLLFNILSLSLPLLVCTLNIALT